MELNAKQQKCAAVLILLTSMSQNAELKDVAIICGKHTLNYSNLGNHALLTEIEPELGELFELYLNIIKTTYLAQSVSFMNSMDFELLGDINKAVERATTQYNETNEMVDLCSFKRTIQTFCENIKYKNTL